MLFQVGPLQFRLGGLAPHEVERRAAADFAEKDVVGALRPAEFVGEGEDVLKFTCKLYTLEQPTGLDAIDTLDAMRLTGTPQMVIRGDGRSMGWRRLTDYTEKHRITALSGIGKVIEYEVSLKLTPAPSANAMLSALVTLIG